MSPMRGGALEILTGWPSRSAGSMQPPVTVSETYSNSFKQPRRIASRSTGSGSWVKSETATSTG